MIARVRPDEPFPCPSHVAQKAEQQGRVLCPLMFQQNDEFAGRSMKSRGVSQIRFKRRIVGVCVPWGLRYEGVPREKRADVMRKVASEERTSVFRLGKSRSEQFVVRLVESGV
jgi:hypothetical protein